jgi:hypothetical protein
LLRGYRLESRQVEGQLWQPDDIGQIWEAQEGNVGQAMEMLYAFPLVPLPEGKRDRRITGNEFANLPRRELLVTTRGV